MPSASTAVLSNRSKKEHFKAGLWENFKECDKNLKIKRENEKQLDPKEVVSLLQYNWETFWSRKEVVNGSCSALKKINIEDKLFKVLL